MTTTKKEKKQQQQQQKAPLDNVESQSQYIFHPQRNSRQLSHCLHVTLNGQYIELNHRLYDIEQCLKLKPSHVTLNNI